jgi:hypothetical protein
MHKGIGISMVAVTALNVIVNTCIMLQKTCKKLKQACQKACYRYNQLKLKI